MAEPSSHRSRKRVLPSSAIVVLFASGALGFHLGYTRYPDWQVPVETAQVLAGVVAYPDATPFYIYHVNLWTILHQICALFLLAGAQEIAQSRVLSGVLGMLSFQALAMVTFALCRRTFLSIGVPMVVFVSQVSQAGAVYPIYLMGMPFTYGIVGLSLIVLVAAVTGAGLYRGGAFLFGIAPAVHPSIGLWLWVVGAICLLVDRRMRHALRPALPALLAGCAITAVSLGVHLVMAAGLTTREPAPSRQYFDAFVIFWDSHRQPIALTSPAVQLNAAALAIATMWLRWFRHELTAPAPWLLRFVQVSAVVGLAFVPVSWVPPQRMPVTLLILMPGRVLNINAMAFAALLFGLLRAGRAPLWRTLLMVVLAAGLLVGNMSALWRLMPAPEWGWIQALDPRQVAFAIAVVLVAGSVIGPWRKSEAARGEPLDAPAGRAGAALVMRSTALAILVLAGVVAYRVAEDRSQVFVDRTNNGFLAAVARGPGLLLTSGDFSLMQLRTRRPQLIEVGALDTVAYMPETAAAMDRILRDIYGIDLFNPPQEVRRAGLLPARVHRATWERYTRGRWQEIRRTYQVTEVLTEADWQLDLPIVAQDRRFLLYRIPE